MKLVDNAVGGEVGGAAIDAALWPPLTSHERALSTDFGWQVSTYSNGCSACVEVSFVLGRVFIRDSKFHKHSDSFGLTEPSISASEGEWVAFLREVLGSQPLGANGAIGVEYRQDDQEAVVLYSLLEGTRLTYTALEWAAFVAGVTRCQFDPPKHQIPALAGGSRPALIESINGGVLVSH